MGIYRYNPATENVHSGSIGGSGAGSVSAALALGNDYPGAVDANWFQAGAYTPNGLYYYVYEGASMAPAAAAIPAGKDIVGVELAVLGQVPSGGGAATSARITLPNNDGADVVLVKSWPDGNAGWGRMVVPNYFVPAVDVPAYLAQARIVIEQSVPLAFPPRIDYFSVYAMFTVGVAAQVSFPVGLTLDASASQVISAAVTF